MTKGVPGPRPHLWITGPDPERHQHYKIYQQHRNQCRHRGEDYALTFAEFEHLWQGLWHRRGRGAGSLQMIRVDPTQPWHTANVCIQDRDVFRARGAYRRRGTVEEARHEA